ncbi:serine carboxypeptidase [Flagelloscypha sp. PMI_526]|nr:serine carboxypeptidase [Flagelloscypha sp. PMI_526]
MPTSLVLVLSLVSLCLAQGEFPIIDGIIGGVPSLNVTSHIGDKSGFRDPVHGVGIERTAGALRYVEDSGVCESKDRAYQASGYGDLTADKSVWFWYFDSRTNPDNAPLTLFFNGGPGSSSMLGLFRELGPCRIKNDSSDVEINEYGWNANSNLMFIDQPVGAGFSHGTLDVHTSFDAAVDVWTFLQIFFSDPKFSKLSTRPLAIWTQSYGGHYGPAFATYFLSQNAKIDSGEISGLKLNLQVLGIGDGLVDPLNQYYGYVDYAKNNPYKQLVNDSVIETGNTSWSQAGGCRDQIQNCYDTGDASVCSNATSYCNRNILTPLAGNWDPNYVLAANPDPYPPSITNWINSVRTQIGAEVTWASNNVTVYINMVNAGDWMSNSADELAAVINAGIKTLIYCGDADYIMNCAGIENFVSLLNITVGPEFNALPLANYTVNGQVTGLYKQVNNFSFLKVYGAGHEVPAYTYGNLAVGQAALKLFEDIVLGSAGLVPS